MTNKNLLFVFGLAFTNLAYAVEVNEWCDVNIDNQYKKVNTGDSDFSAFTYSTNEMKLKYISISLNEENFEFSKKDKMAFDIFTSNGFSFYMYEFPKGLEKDFRQKVVSIYLKKENVQLIGLNQNEVEYALKSCINKSDIERIKKYVGE
ncbi:hypothetical protein [Pseudoalteromonas luteoviolacea]|uniref:Uncharacterized protein n=1 Tax=Pseudoalteromonas luteoviolacea NCIMB 1942 TaxID=1365253 RepID=A0A161YC21_9GAMM|nr:hypothetical protein [Pseudoalteromonas luteoviolacea]KZN57181.1 hypothetical protein N482_23955 [Pseudoalteromonas luteoviolacea NCIMB 1942]